MTIYTCCNKCGCTNIKKNGHDKNGKQQYFCKDCKSGFIIDYFQRNMDDMKKELIKKALLERNSLRGICRIFSVTLTWLLKFAVKLYSETPNDLGANLEHFDGFETAIIKTECDEMWSFVGKKSNKKWIWIIIERSTRQVIAFHIGGRTAKDGKKLWSKIPKKIKDNFIVYTDFLKSYEAFIPKKSHVASGKDAGQTNHIERLNCTIRQRVSRLVRDSLSFSKKIENHTAAIGYFLFHYNLQLRTIIANE